MPCESPASDRCEARAAIGEACSERDVSQSESLARQPVLTTQRLVLRPITEGDSAALHELFGDSEAMRHMTYPTARSLADTAKIMAMLLFPLPDLHGTWVVIAGRSQTTMGMVSYHHRENWNRRVELGFALARRHWHHGFMNEAVAALLVHCFGELGMNRVEATVNPENGAAIRLLDRLGFRFEGGPLRGRQHVNGIYRDQLIYGLLRDEWRMLPIEGGADKLCG